MKSPLLSCIVIACLVLSIPTSVYAQEQAQQKDQPQLKADRPNSYTVVKGDTLWDISTRFLEDPWRWKEIWQGNSQIANPDLIYPGDEIRLIFVAGKPQFVVNSNAPSTPSTNNSDRYSTTSDHNKPLKTVKLTPKIYSTGIKTAIPAIPLEKINAFLLRNRVVEADTLKKAAHVVAGQEKRVILSAGDSLYVRGDFSNEVNSYGLYRQGLRYHDPETSEIIGVQAVDIGAADLRSKTGDIGNFVVTRSTSEIRVGDRLLPILEREINSTFLPKPPENTVDGVIMSVEKGCLSVPGFYETVKRPVGVKIEALDRNGEPFKLEPDGLLAICIQHEIDHLNGKLFVDYLSSMKRQRIRKKLEKQHRAH